MQHREIFLSEKTKKRGKYLYSLKWVNNLGPQYGGENGAVLGKKKLIFLTLPYKVLLWQPNVSANTKHSIGIEKIKCNAEGEETWLQICMS